MTTQVFAIGDTGAGTMEKIKIERRAVGSKDVLLKILYCGVCHSDYHHCKNEWGPAKRPSVPGHEIVGIVEAIGNQVTKFKVGQHAAVGCFVDSCGTCDECQRGLIQYCSTSLVQTYGTSVSDGTGHTKGGYSETIVTKEDFVLRVPDNLDLAKVAPLLCAGITTWSPLKHFGVKAGDHVGVLGLGGLGHMAVKFAIALGAKVTVISRSPAKDEWSKKFGASVLHLTDSAAVKAANRTMDIVIDTVSAAHDINTVISFLRTDGTLVMLGGVAEPLQFSSFGLLLRRVRIAGSLVGGIIETQEMLDFCGKHGIASEIELVPCSYVNEAWERMVKGDVFFRFVLDIGKTIAL
jgi:uncharacterized zinc-type alcohol dehydrogenase-like protein